MIDQYFQSFIATPHAATNESFQQNVKFKMFWGLTPAVNFLSEYETKTQTCLPDELNILLFGSADCRHILQTIAKQYRHKKVKLHFYVVETCGETIARQIMLLYTALRPTEELALVQKTRTFMELYGNSLLRPAVAKYLRHISYDFVKFITDFEYMKQKIPFVEMELKYKERDYLENLFKFWCGEDDFNICDSWDRRLRKILGIRYDNKLGAFDWDLHMRFHPVGGQQVCNQEYRNFRANGVAFTWLESDVSKPNRSLVCGVIPNGEKFVHYGYLGDMQTGPFVAYGLTCEDEVFTKRSNGHNLHRATDVVERNLKQIFYELEAQKPYEHQSTTDLQMGTMVTKLSEIRVVDVKERGACENKKSEPCINVGNTKITFLSLDYLQHKQKYRSVFDLIYFNNSYLKFLNREIISNAANKSCCFILIENQRFVLNLRDKDLEEHKNNILEKVDGLDCEIKFDALKDDYCTCILKSK